MATESGRVDPSLKETLFDEPYRFSAFQAIRLLERIYTDRRPVGRDGDPMREVAHFSARISLEFPASEIYKLEREGDGDRPEPPKMVEAFLGLTGPIGVLPTHYTELVMERNRYGDRGLAAFFDMFNHRMVSLLFRAWEKYRFPVAFERQKDDRFTEYLFDIVGMGTRGHRGRSSFEDLALVYYGGLVSQKPHSATAVEAIVGDYFGVKATAEQLTGQWLNLDAESVTRLGFANSQLGYSTVVGTRVWDTQSKFRVRLGPLTLAQFREFLPVGSAFQRLKDLTRVLVGMEFDFDVQPVLAASEVPACVLDTKAKPGPMLGWTTFMKTRPFARDATQVVLAT